MGISRALYWAHGEEVGKFESSREGGHCVGEDDGDYTEAGTCLYSVVPILAWNTHVRLACGDETDGDLGSSSKVNDTTKRNKEIRHQLTLRYRAISTL